MERLITILEVATTSFLLYLIACGLGFAENAVPQRNLDNASGGAQSYQKRYEMHNDRISRIKARLRHEKVNGFEIGAEYIDAPLNRIFLIRNKGKYGAVKFTEADYGKEMATYQWYFGISKDGRFVGDATKRGTRKADSWIVGWGRFQVQLGHGYVQCGKFRLPWGAPTRVLFLLDEPGLEIGPLDVNAIEKVSVYDNTIRWYRYDPLVDELMKEIKRFQDEG